MRNKVARTGLAVIFTASLLLSTASLAQPAKQVCSLGRSAGNWAFTDNGTVVGIGPRTAVGVFTLDGAGNLKNGVATSSLNGSVAQETFSGTYTVNSDCTGTASITIYSGGTEILALTMNLAFNSGMREMRTIFSSASLPDGTQLLTVINLDARKQ
jgi:hypothetical protein